MHNYLLFYLIILPISYLPYRALYLLSDFLYLVLYRIAGYRKAVVHTNLVNSFPEKSAKEILNIEKEFFRHFCDLILESIKAFTISEKQAQNRFKTRNPELPNKYFEQGRNIAIVGGHYGNWELLAITIDRQIRHKTIALYKTMTNKFFDKKMTKSRSKYGLTLLSLGEYRVKGIDQFKNETSATIFGSDQSPRKLQKAYWMKFLNQDTPVQFGLEKFARKYNTPVIYGDIHRLKRGFFEIEYHLVCEDPLELPEGALTEKYTKMLEEIVMERPEYWLWSHKRWKLKKPVTKEVVNN